MLQFGAVKSETSATFSLCAREIPLSYVYIYANEDVCLALNLRAIVRHNYLINYTLIALRSDVIDKQTINATLACLASKFL